jgi:hypothetical protein
MVERGGFFKIIAAMDTTACAENVFVNDSDGGPSEARGVTI